MALKLGKDNNPKCDAFVELCTDNIHGAFLKQNCAKSCGHCGDESKSTNYGTESVTNKPESTRSTIDPFSSLSEEIADEKTTAKLAKVSSPRAKSMGTTKKPLAVTVIVVKCENTTEISPAVERKKRKRIPAKNYKRRKLAPNKSNSTTTTTKVSSTSAPSLAQTITTITTPSPKLMSTTVLPGIHTTADSVNITTKIYGANKSNSQLIEPEGFENLESNCKF